MAFAKFVKTQVADKNKILDTGLIGIFMKVGDEQVCYFPSPEFLEAGKFRLLRETLREKGSGEYSGLYLKKMGKSEEVAPSEEAQVV